MKDEREDILETYRDMSTEELLDHWESGTLTEYALQTAAEELVRRGVALPPVEQIEAENRAAAPPEDAVLETIAHSYEPTEMQILRGRLEADGIPAVVIDDNVNLTNSVLAEHGGLRLEVAAQHAEEATRIVAEVRSGKLALDDAPADAPPEEIAETPAPNWEFLVTAAVFSFACFEFAKTIWFARTFNTDIEWDAVSVLALALPVLYFLGALLLVFRSKWALPCFALHLPVALGSAFVLTPDAPIEINQVTGWICTAAIVYFCVHLRRQERLG
jgi:hypothetical protein